MTEHISTRVLDEVIAVGRASDVAQALDALFAGPFRDRMPRATLFQNCNWLICESLTHEDFAAVIRTMTIAEDRWFPGAGSTSLVIHLYRAFAQRFPSEADTLAEWVLAHTSNRRLPFGSSNGGARSLKELAELAAASAANAARRAKRLEPVRAREAAARMARVARATSNLYNAVRRGDVKAVAALLAQGADPLAQGPIGLNAIELARTRGRQDLVAILQPISDGAAARSIAQPLGHTRMDDSNRQRWLGVAILVGALYFAMSIASTILADGAASSSMRFMWRWSAFIGSGVVFAAHIGYEHFRLGNLVRPTAWHTSVAAALGGLALALSANIHDLGSAAGYRPRMLIALVAWPLLTGVPAYVVAMVVVAVLRRMRPWTSQGRRAA